MKKILSLILMVLTFCLSLCVPAGAEYSGVGRSNFRSVSNFSEGLAVVESSYINEGYGFMDTEGKLVIPCQYQVAYSFSEGLAPVKYQDGTWAFIDKTGAEVLNLGREYGVVNPFYDGVAVVSGFGYDALDGLIDKTGKEIVPRQYDLIDYFVDGLAPARDTEDNWYFLDTKGNVVLSLGNQYAWVENFHDGLAKVSNPNIPGNTSQSHRYGFIDKTGKEVIPCQYYQAYDFSDGYAAVQNQDKLYGLIDTSGKTVLPFQYGSLGPLSDGIITARDPETKNYGFIDLEGNEILPFKYMHANNFSEGYAAVMLKGDKGYGFIDKYGRDIIPHRYTNVRSFRNGLVAVSYGGSDWGFLATDGKPIGTGFEDASIDAYYGEPVCWAIEKGITKGTSATTFSPDTTCTNAQILTFLWRAYGQPKATISNPYTDVSESDYFYQAALWAYEKGLLDGNEFRASKECTRGATVSYFWRLSGKPTMGTNGFTDIESGTDLAKAVSWAVEKGITKGTGADTFSPEDICSRGQIATFLFRLINQ